MGCCGNKKHVRPQKRFGSKKRFYIEQAKKRQERLRKLNQKLLEEKKSPPSSEELENESEDTEPSSE